MIREKILLSTAISKSIVSIAVIVLVTALSSIGMTSIVQGQTNSTSSSSSSSISLTPEQKDAICNPNNPASRLNPVNTTESRICGIPVTVKPHTSNATSSSAAVNTTTNAQEVSPSPPPPAATSIAPSAVPPSQ